jgi:hypothetical protein
MKNFKKPKINLKLLDIKISADRVFESDDGFGSKL